jgi:hypothetical protein
VQAISRKDCRARSDDAGFWPASSRAKGASAYRSRSTRRLPWGSTCSRASFSISTSPAVRSSKWPESSSRPGNLPEAWQSDGIGLRDQFPAGCLSTRRAVPPQVHGVLGAARGHGALSGGRRPLGAACPPRARRLGSHRPDCLRDEHGRQAASERWTSFSTESSEAIRQTLLARSEEMVRPPWRRGELGGTETT